MNNTQELQDIKKSPVRKLPEGKEQFGIIVRTDIHKTAKHLATDMGLKISDVYSAGVLKLAEEQASAGTSRSAILGREICDGIAEADWKYFRAVAGFLRSGPDENWMGMLRSLLHKFLPATENQNNVRHEKHA